MGSDNLFHKRKKRRAESLKRERAKRKPYDRVLIVCEGSKTEPRYLDELCRDFRLSTANIKICAGGCDPSALIDFAIKEYKRDKDFDRVYCVFDKDKHTAYQAALDKIGKKKFFPITSVPCFEFWLLLHFGYTTKPFNNCDQVLSELKNHIPGYAKADVNIFNETKDKLDDAIGHADRAQRYHETSGTDNPSTGMHELVVYLRGLNQT